MNFFSKIRARTRAVTQSMEQAQEAVAFAEAGLTPDHGKPVDQAKARKLLVMGHESSFSDSVISYALEMAQRMSYEIVALNTAPISCGTLSQISTSQKKICQEFQDLSVESAKGFKTAAEKLGIPFLHVIKFNEPEQALTTVQREFKNIEFIISDEQAETSVNRVADAERPTNQIYVYSML